MDLKDIFAISGKPGLYKFISQGRNSLMIVENLEDKKRTTAFTTAKISSLEDIAIFTDTEDMALKDVFKAIYEKENGAASIDHKSSGKVLGKYFDEVIPAYDRKRVYVSDIKKVVLWYNILQKLELLDFSEDKDDKDEKDSEKPDEKQNKNKDKDKESGKGKGKTT
ncbi:MAG: DUF5606 domain-containing protein [Bacteroidetes bacterium]|nr:DUF5606 domain-containing protein [Bacteroidota bacterium]